jgi:protoporphyrinogen IX oxidase
VDYLWLKALHVTAVLVWMSGLLAVALGATSAAKVSSSAEGRSALIERTLRWDQRVTLPAMLLAWGAGGTLATLGGWFHSPWLIVKIGIVGLLSALHAILSGTLRRLAYADAASPPSWLVHARLLIVAGVTAIVVLVVVKPF